MRGNYKKYSRFKKFASRYGLKPGPIATLRSKVFSKRRAPIGFTKHFNHYLKENGYASILCPEDVLKPLNKSPSLIVDVGVQAGTPWLYRFYDDKPFLLVDPQRGGEERLKSRPKEYKFMNVGLGSVPGSMTITEEGALSSFLNRTAHKSAEKHEKYVCEITTLDDVLDEHLLAGGNFGLKIDTEGFEMEIMRGLDRHLDQISFLIAEVRVIDRFDDSYNFSEFVAYMLEKNLRFFNIMSVQKKRAPWYDCLFLKSDDTAFKD